MTPSDVIRRMTGILDRVGIEDAAGILRIRSQELDRDYIRTWVRDLGLEAQWKAAVDAAGPLSA
jgi:hypothetical protein